MNKKAFTLIELLAVIVILAIIALIAVPIVVNIINDSKEESVKRSINLYLDALEKTITQENLKGKYNPDKCVIQEDGNVICSENGKELVTSNASNKLEMQIKGEKPKSGIIKIENGKVIDIVDIYINKQYYGFDSNKNIILFDMPKTPGTYDKNYKLLATWDELVNDYGLEVTNGILKNVNNVLKNSQFANVKTFIISDDINTLGYSAFYQCKNLETIIIPNSVTKIDAGVFNGCNNLTTITLPKSVTSIGYSIFNGCNNLKTIKVSPSNPKYEDRGSNAIIEKSTNTLIFGGVDTVIPTSVTKIGSHAFEGRKNLTSIIIPSSVESIGEFAFDGCSELTSVTIPNSVESIGVAAFRDCTKLNSVTFEENSKLTSIEGSAFRGCSSLTSIEIPNGVTSIGSNSFSRTGLENITIPNSVTKIGEFAFEYCSNLTTITIPDSVINIGYCAFQYCNKLKSIELSSNITKIETQTFKNCSDLTNIVIPRNVTEIGYQAFHYSGLTSATFEDINGWYITDLSNVTTEDSMDVTNVSTNGSNLRGDTYGNKIWKRNTD